ncbi:MAG: FAD:protein FMN transferase [Opitutaceae bacterium]
MIPYLERSITACVLLMALLLCACSRDAYKEFSMDTMGTNLRIVYTGDSAWDTDAVSKLLESINGELSTWREDSWISQFNQAAEGLEVDVPSHARVVLKNALEVAELSGGALDPTIYPLMRAWGFANPRGSAQRVVDPVELKALQAVCGYKQVVFDPETGTITKRLAGVQLDLSASAKGYAVDQIANYIDQHGVTDFLVEIGGEFRAQGLNPKGQVWTVAIEAPQAYSSGLPRIELGDLAVATSGGAQAYKRIDSDVFLHIIDPRTLEPLTNENELYSVSVTADTCMLADSLATAAFVLGPQALAGIKGRYPEAEFVFLMQDGRKIER